MKKQKTLTKIEGKVGFVLIVIVLLGLFALIFLKPVQTGEAAFPLENSKMNQAGLDKMFRLYFIMSSIINVYTNKAFDQLAADANKYGAPQKPLSQFNQIHDILHAVTDAVKSADAKSFIRRESSAITSARIETER